MYDIIAGISKYKYAFFLNSLVIANKYSPEKDELFRFSCQNKQCGYD